MPIVLAHGALGNFDEILFLGIGIIFVSMMGISWLRSRSTPPKLDDADKVQPPTATGDQDASAASVPPDESADRFPLE